MTPSTSLPSPDRVDATADRGFSLPSAAPAIAGFAYVVTWAVGLSVFPVNLALDAPASEIVDAYAKQSALGTLQFVLVEGLAGILLAFVLALLATTQQARGYALSRSALVSAAVAVMISLTQCALGLSMIAASQQHTAHTAFDLYGAVNRLDGVKMLALAFLAASLARHGSGALPLILRVCSVALALTLLGSGVSYLLLWNALAWTVYVSGPVLLLWVAGLGLWLSIVRRRMRREPA
ncbi:hypothetical protein [Leifsonia sp. NPDC058230]|uniref:hypothetical protein n=1 Tax=Leifsonia sp. NPDC058230 TaxID=3346391 RepID=UPI0036DF865D